MLRVFVTALVDAWNDNVPRLGASLAYYTLFAVAPIVIVATVIGSHVYAGDAVRSQLLGELNAVVGDEGGRAVQALVSGARFPGGGMFAATAGAIAFVLGSTGVFLELQAALDTIWRVKPRPGLHVVSFLLDRARSFGVVIAVGLVLLLSLGISTALSAAANWLASWTPAAPLVLSAVNVTSSFAMSAVLFAMVYRYLPDVELAWRDVATGAVMTAVLFTAGEYLIGLYLGSTTVASAYGAAGSVVLLLLWVYYSAQILLIGAEFTRVHAEHRGLRPPPQNLLKTRH